jgi:hypothetical protein
MANNQNNSLLQVGVGWLKQSKSGSEFVSGSLADKKGKTKVFVETEDGTVIPVGSFFMFFNENKQKETHPDVRFCISTDAPQAE